MAYQDYIDIVEKIYIAYYQRPADPLGLIYWAQRLDASNGNLNEIIDAFANSPEAQSLYGNIDENNIGNVIKAIYQAAFNRDPDPIGLEFYTNGFKEGKFTPATIMLDILNGAQADDLIILNNKVQSAINFTKAIDPELDGENLLATYAGNEDAQKARDFLKDIGSTTFIVKTVNDAINFIKINIADPQDLLIKYTDYSNSESNLSDDNNVNTLEMDLVDYENSLNNNIDYSNSESNLSDDDNVSTLEMDLVDYENSDLFN